ncbi:transglycosylase domain-containing protein [Vibrio parahaemolyticus]|uniref:transglycosylase domain-containing protein n=1 Tax=Vibrio parahaemolyticus TaxID=670 RepID=UPI001331AFD9|nr:transglycosylase domain-containing protein [Vibrio parahaemolyticus]
MVIDTVNGLQYTFPSNYGYYLLLAEDHRGRYHYGVDQLSFIRILAQFIKSGKRQGGSTIEQQLVRTITGKYERKIKRKLLEQLLAISVSRVFDKDEMISAYLQVAYMGTELKGIFELADHLNLDLYKDSEELSVEFSARLKYPEPSKLTHSWYTKYRRRKLHILFIANKKSGQNSKKITSAYNT